MVEGQSGAPTPEAWIGKRVTVVGSQHSITGELIEINDRGVVVSYTRTARRRGYGGFTEDQQTSERRFYPWEQVRLIRFVEEEQERG